ncbi:MAG: S-methyl-5-thioribose-1-phosphate isomerase [Pseudomonadota bacterium]
MTRNEILGLLGQKFFTIRWAGDHVEMIDQRLLPHEETYMQVTTVDDMIPAIQTMAVRGAPAIGIAGAMGVCLAVVEAGSRGGDPEAHVRAQAQRLENARPTAINLRWAVRRAMACWEKHAGLPPAGRKAKTIAEAEDILREDIDMCLRMGDHGAKLIPDNAAVMTLCNAGALATGGHGTALSVIRGARRAGKAIRVFACETRPLLQGARLTSWELVQDGFDTTLICDSAAGHLMAAGEIDAVVVGSDRVAKNGDCANKIGTYMLSVLAKENSVPFYIAVPTTTIDPDTPDGKAIPIEERDPAEVTDPRGVRFAAAGVKVRNPAFDVTPAANITRIVTENGAFRPADIMKSLPGRDTSKS